MDIEVVVETRTYPGEGPVWDPVQCVLWWVDIMGEVVHRFDPSNGKDTVTPVGQPIGCIGRRASGWLVAGLREGFGHVDPSSGAVEVFWRLPDNEPALRFNDGEVDASGRLYAGTMAIDFTRDAGALYRLDPDGTVTELFGGVTVSNGIAWSPDNATMYYIDSLQGGVDAFDYDASTGEISDRRRAVETPRDGFPDGMTVDADGGLWVAFHGGGAVRRFDPDGTLSETIELPVRLVTSVAFGGEDLSDLYITTDASRLDEDALREQPLAGSLFRCRPGVAGQPQHAFAG